MENQPQNPEFRNNPENFHPCLVEPSEENFNYALFSADLCTITYESSMNP